MICPLIRKVNWNSWISTSAYISSMNLSLTYYNIQILVKAIPSGSRVYRQL